MSRLIRIKTPIRKYNLGGRGKKKKIIKRNLVLAT